MHTHRCTHTHTYIHIHTRIHTPTHILLIVLVCTLYRVMGVGVIVVTNTPGTCGSGAIDSCVYECVCDI